MADDNTTNDYVSRSDQDKSQVPVQSDNAPVDDPIGNTSQDSDEQLGLWPSFIFVILFDTNLNSSR